MALIDSHAKWRNNLIDKILPRNKWVQSSVWITHGTGGVGPRYQVKLSHPPDWHLSDADFGSPNIKESEEDKFTGAILSNPEHLSKGYDSDDGMYVSIHNGGPHGKHRSVLILPTSEGNHKITGGDHGFYGLRLHGVMPHEMYVNLSKHRHQQYKEDKEIQDLVKRSMAPQLTANNEPYHPNARKQIIVKPTESQSVDLAKVLRSGRDAEFKNNSIDRLTNLSGEKFDWLNRFIESNSDKPIVVIVGDDVDRKILDKELGGAHHSGAIQNDEPAVYFMSDHPPRSEAKYNVINYDKHVDDVRYYPERCLSHIDLLLDTYRERKRLK